MPRRDQNPKIQKLDNTWGMRYLLILNLSQRLAKSVYTSDICSQISYQRSQTCFL